ncbi:MAG: hypothetical protein PVJ84_09350 [Desulfobacteraceae bacterium]|jgi:hypothetical protein
MPKSFAIGLIIVFISHFGVFLSFFVRRKRVHYIFLMGTFLLLALYLVVRFWWGDFTLFGHFGYTYLRVASWITSGFGLLVYVRFRFVVARERR